MGIAAVSTSCGPECARVFDRQVGSLVRKAGADASVRVVLVTFPTLEQRTNDSDGAGTIDLKIPLEGAQEELAFPAVLDVGVPEIELQLSVNIRQMELGNSKERTFRLLFGVQGRACDGRVEHELMEVRVVADGMIDDFIDVFRRMLLDADDARTEPADPVRLQRADQRHRIRSRQLA